MFETTDNPRIFRIGDFRDDAIGAVFEEEALKLKRKGHKYYGVVIHTADFKPAPNQHLVFDIDLWHKQRKTKKGKNWAGIGYAFIVEQDGTVYTTFRFVEHNKVTGQRSQAHCIGHWDWYNINRDFIGICISGEGTLEGMTEAQRRSTAKLIYRLAKVFHIEPGFLFSHAVLQGNKFCPGFYVAKDFWVLERSLTAGYSAGKTQK